MSRYVPTRICLSRTRMGRPLITLFLRYLELPELFRSERSQPWRMIPGCYARQVASCRLRLDSKCAKQFLIAVVLALAGCDDTGYSPRDLVACTTKAVDALGPVPPACPEDASDYLRCRSDAAIAITEYERKRGLYVQDCMEAAGYNVSEECSAEWTSLVNLPQCYY
jgi:hypothetical protein